MKASEFKSSLLDAGLDAAQADELVKARVAAGGVEDDLGDTSDSPVPEVDLADLDKHLDALEKSFGEDAGEDGGGANSHEDPLAKAVYDDAGVDDGVLAVVEEIAKGADRIAKGTAAQVQALAKGQLALAKTSRAVAQGQNTIAHVVGVMAQRLEAVEKALRAPLPGRAVTGLYQPQPAPGEQPATGASGTPPVDRRALINKAIGELRTGASAARAAQLKRAIAELEVVGTDPAAIAAQHGL